MCPPLHAIHIALDSSINSEIHLEEDDDNLEPVAIAADLVSPTSFTSKTADNPHPFHNSSKTSTRPPPEATAITSMARFLSCPVHLNSNPMPRKLSGSPQTNASTSGTFAETECWAPSNTPTTTLLILATPPSMSQIRFISRT